MKKVILLVLLAFSLNMAFSQMVTDVARKKFTFGFGLFSDIWMNVPDNIKARTINQGTTVWGTYNFPFGKSNFSFAAGLGINSHNLYGNFLVNHRNDSIFFDKIADTTKYKRSKLSLTYLDIPIEFRLTTKYKLLFAIGFKAGLIVNSHTKYVGNNYMTGSDQAKIRVKYRDVKNLEKYHYGPTLRIGYKWINVFGYYSLSSVFNKGKSPEITPITVGILLSSY
ncbi:MAG: PorT family protein [Bacteroidetes bacterium]|nr:PorT family protein [Bacteroidota bacterium]